MKIIKRDGTINNFEVDKIKNAILKACQEIGKDMSDSEILNIVMNVVSNINSYMEENKLTEINVEQIQDFVEKNLSDYKDILIAYKNYRRERNRIRDTKTDIMKTVKAIGVETDRDNANVGNNFSAKLLRIASESNKWTQTSSVIPKEMAKLHENGDLYFHDLDSYNLTTNCTGEDEYLLLRDNTNGQNSWKKFSELNKYFTEENKVNNTNNNVETVRVNNISTLGRLGFTNIRYISRRKLNENEKMYKLNTRRNKGIYCTGEHKIPVIRDGKEVLLEAKQIMKGDKLLLAKNITSANKDSEEIIRIDIIDGYNGYVYDLETDEHWFSVNDYIVHNCLHVPTRKMLTEGFNTGYGTIKRPQRIESAAELSCILLQASQNDCFGGQSHPNFDNDMGLFVEPTRQEIKNEYLSLGIDNDEKVEEKVEKRIHQAMQAVVYNLNSMHSRAGSQVPFSSVNIGIPESKDAALVCKVFLEEYNKGLGNGEQPIFPNIIFRVKDGVNAKEGDPYYYLYELACKVAAKHMNPTFMNINADFNKEYYDKGYIPATMGCRTYLMSNINGEPGTEGRGNIAPITMNLPRMGLQANGSIEKFYEILDKRLIQSRDCLLHRYSILKELKVKDLPFVAGQKLMKGSENLSMNDSIEPILKQGTWGIGFIGLAETLIALTGKHHGEDGNSRKLGYEIIKHIRDFCDKTTKEFKLNFSAYATPAEGLSGKFISKDIKIFGKIKGITDKKYYTNSFHVPVGYQISIKEKIDIEAPYHKLCNGGHISYIELDNCPSSEVIKSIVDYAFNNTNIGYFGINFHIKYCKDCGTYLLNEQDTCPKCNSKNIQGISRVTGYLSLDERFAPEDSFGKGAEKADRISHNKKEKFISYKR